MIEWVNNHIDAIMSLFSGGLLGYIASARRRKAETERIIQDNEQHVISMYRTALDDMEKRLKGQIDGLQKEIDSLHDELMDCKKKAGLL